MGSFKLIDYNQLRVGHINFTGETRFTDSSTQYRSYPIRNGIACLGYGPHGEPAKYYLSSRACYYTPVASKLFISKDVKTARDLFRNSGYTIVRDIEKSDVVVVPAVREDYQQFVYEVAAYDPQTSNLYLYTVNRNENVRRRYYTSLDGDFDAIKSTFEARGWAVLSEDIEGSTCNIVQNCNEYREILLNTYPQRHYVSETRIPLDSPVTISPETLLLWSRYTDMRLLAKAICASDWKEYPFTVLMMILYEQGAVVYSGGENMKLVLQQIGYNPNASTSKMILGRTVTPKDWNMLQSYIMKKMGIPETGGFCNFSALNGYSDIIKKKVAVAPMTIDTPQLTDNLFTLNKS